MSGYFIRNKYADCITCKVVYSDNDKSAIARAREALATCENPKDVKECRLYKGDMDKEETWKLVKVIRKEA